MKIPDEWIRKVVTRSGVPLEEWSGHWVDEIVTASIEVYLQETTAHVKESMKLVQHIHN